MAGRPGAVHPHGSVQEQLPNIKKLIMEAQTLDDNGDELVGRSTYTLEIRTQPPNTTTL